MRRMKLLFSASALAVLLAAMFAHVAQAPSAPAPPVSSDPLIALLESTTAAWNAGDLDGFIAPYAESSTFMTSAGPIGHADMRARYQKRYFANGRPDQQLRFEQMTVRHLGADHAVMIGRFVLGGGGKPDQSGWFTLVWMRTSKGWKIIHDHSS